MEAKELKATPELMRLRDPAVFVGTLCMDHALVDWQKKFLRACRVVDERGKIKEGFPRYVALAAVNGSGKTELLSGLIRYLLSTVPGCMVGLTSSVYRQLEMVRKYLDKGSEKFKEGWHCVDGLLRAPNGNEARWFCADNAGSVESFHAPFMVRILDEVKSISDDIIDATNRWHPSLSIFVSSKGNASGEFYRCFTVNRTKWERFEVDSSMCPWLSKDFLDGLIREKGENHPLVASMIRNEWSDVTSRSLISLSSINKCLDHPPIWLNDGVVAGVDLSAARKDGDECVIMWREGNHVREPFIIRGAGSEMEVVGICIRQLKGIGAKHVFLDEGGMGGPMISRMQEILEGDHSIELHRINFGGKSKMLSANRGTEIWEEMARKIERREIAIPRDDRLIGQLTSREFEVKSDGKLKLVSKEVMRRRGLDSPDRADSLALCLMEPEKVNAITLNDAEQDDLTNQSGSSIGLVGHSLDGKYDLGM